MAIEQTGEGYKQREEKTDKQGNPARNEPSGL
jgi:hypothetical protein